MILVITLGIPMGLFPSLALSRRPEAQNTEKRILSIMGQHHFLDNSTIEKCVSHDQRKLQLVKKTCEENVESAIDVFLEEASSVNSWQKLYQ